MNCFVVSGFCAVFLIAATNAASADTYKLQYQKYQEECQKSTNTSPESIQKVIRDESFESASLGAHLLCLNQKYNMQDEKGEVNPDVVRTVMNNLYHSPEAVEEVVKNCAKKPEGSTPEIVAVKLVKCSRKYINLESGE